jgi:choline dehydrogenase
MIHYPKAYYEPNKSRPNLILLDEAEANRIVFNKDPAGQLVAQGVEYRKDDQTLTVRAIKEVILCAGAFLWAHLVVRN